MLALSMLQAMYSGSNSFTEEERKENIYWQYFCGYEYLQANLDPDFRSFLKADASKAFVYKGCIFLGTTFNFYL